MEKTVIQEETTTLQAQGEDQEDTTRNPTSVSVHVHREQRQHTKSDNPRKFLFFSR
jgi:hypothetical protein